jgi:ATP-dependent helicase HepA
MNGLIVIHRAYGYGKVIAVGSAGATVTFCGSGQTVKFGRQAFIDEDLKHARLLVQTAVRGPRGRCVVTVTPSPMTGSDSVFTYGVKYEDGLTARVSEIELTPLASFDSATASDQLSSFSPQPLRSLIARENFVDALNALLTQAGGLRALLSGRIDLHPHQAYVAGTVILDGRRRYILADDVGLGKTIEAGIVIHDLLMQQREARVLILSPASLSRQWLCEMHSSFGGQDFRLLDLHPAESIRWDQWKRVICSTNFALRELSKPLEQVPWDMVVVDEVHHLLESEFLYDWIARLAARCRDLLLLSALPARNGALELLKLLRLLEPAHYASGQPACDRFQELYDQQIVLSRRLRRLARGIRDVETGEAELDELRGLIDNLLKVPLVGEDAELQAIAGDARANGNQVVALATTMCEQVVDRYRINRRILRNRRTQLIEAQLLAPIRRTVHLHQYIPTQLEIDSHEAVQALLIEARGANCPSNILRPLVRMLLGHLSSASLLQAVLIRLKASRRAELHARALELINVAGGSSYDDWDLVEDVICAGARKFLDASTIESAIRAAKIWGSTTDTHKRFDALFTLLRGFEVDRQKVLVFAGLRGLADETAAVLEQTFGPQQVARFTCSLSAEDKEESVRRFRGSGGCWLLVCDETGGEGRNFQFANALIHFDLPWSVSAIEQRIGRLDRLGREGDVPSHIVLNTASIEVGWQICLEKGFGVFTQSISGIEFSLGSQQGRVLDAAIDGIDALADLAPSIASDAEQQRAADEANAVVDEASRRGLSLSRFTPHAADSLDAQVEKSFVQYFRSIASDRAVRSVSDAKTPTGLWKFYADDVRHIRLQGLDADVGGLHGTYTGTFDRTLARTRRDIAFLSYGNRFFDAVADCALSEPSGRSFAVALSNSGLPSTEVFEIQVIAEPCFEAIENDWGLANRARLVIDRRRMAILLTVGTLQRIREDSTLQLIQQVRSGEHPATDLKPEVIADMAARHAVTWSEHVQEAVEVACRAAREALAPRVEMAIEQELKLIRQQGSSWTAESLEAFSAALQRWTIQVDTVGLVVFK